MSELIPCARADPVVELALARRIMSDTAVDGFAATAMVADISDPSER